MWSGGSHVGEAGASNGMSSTSPSFPCFCVVVAIHPLRHWSLVSVVRWVDPSSPGYMKSLVTKRTDELPRKFNCNSSAVLYIYQSYSDGFSDSTMDGPIGHIESIFTGLCPPPPPPPPLDGVGYARTSPSLFHTSYPLPLGLNSGFHQPQRMDLGQDFRGRDTHSQKSQDTIDIHHPTRK